MISPIPLWALPKPWEEHSLTGARDTIGNCQSKIGNPNASSKSTSHMGKIAMIDFLKYVVCIGIYRHHKGGAGYVINSKNFSKRSIASG